MSPVRATWVPPQNSFDSPMVTTRTVSPYFSPKKAMAPAFLASAIARTSVTAGALPRTRWLTRSSTCCFSSGDSGAKCEKSKRRRSSATSEPFWVTCSPSTLRSAQCRRWVAEWLRRMALRRSPSTRQVDHIPDAQLAVGDVTEVDVQARQGAFDVGHLHRRLGAAHGPGVADLAALFAVERGLAGHHGHPARVRPDRVHLDPIRQ